MYGNWNIYATLLLLTIHTRTSHFTSVHCRRLKTATENTGETTIALALLLHQCSVLVILIVMEATETESELLNPQEVASPLYKELLNKPAFVATFCGQQEGQPEKANWLFEVNSGSCGLELSNALQKIVSSLGDERTFRIGDRVGSFWRGITRRYNDEDQLQLWLCHFDIKRNRAKTGFLLFKLLCNCSYITDYILSVLKSGHLYEMTIQDFRFWRKERLRKYIMGASLVASVRIVEDDGPEDHDADDGTKKTSGKPLF